MNPANIWIITGILVAAISIFFLIILCLRNSKTGKLTLFRDEGGSFFRGVVQRLNLFLIVKKSDATFKLNHYKGEPPEKRLVDITGNNSGLINGPENKPSKKIYSHFKKRNYSRTLRAKPVSKGQNKGLIKKKQNEKKRGNVLIRVNNLKDLAKHLHDSNMEHILDYLKKEDYEALKSIILGKTFDSEKELLDYLKDEIIHFLISEVNFLKDRISKLRKKGIDVQEISFSVMSAPLKIKIFEASFETKDFERVVKLLKDLSEEIRLIEGGFNKK